MAAANIRASASRPSGAQVGRTVRNALQQAVAGLQEAMVLMEEREERRAEEMEQLMRTVERAGEALRHQEEVEELRRRVQRAEEALRQQEERAEEAERARAAEVQLLREEVQDLKRRQEGAVGQAPNAAVEGRLRMMEESLKKTLDVFFPRVEAMVAHMERRSPPEQQSAAPSASAPLTACVPSQPLTPQRNDSLGRKLCHDADEGDVEDVKRALDSGADINFVVDGWTTPLLNAANRAHASVVALLLERGADVHLRSGAGWTALHYAACSDRSGRCVSLLIGAGADVHCTDENGNTPMHCATYWDNDAGVRALHAAGASKTTRNNAGETPFDKTGSDAVRRFLRE